MVRRDATASLKEIIHEQRSNPTNAEDLLWQLLRNKQLAGHKFLRQHPAGGYILDFYCSKLKIAIELDGEVHKTQRDYDRIREKDLEGLGIITIRFWNSEVENHPDLVLEKIKQKIHQVESGELSL